MVVRSYIQNLFKKSSSLITSLTLDHAIVSTQYSQSIKTLHFYETKEFSNSTGPIFQGKRQHSISLLMGSGKIPKATVLSGFLVDFGYRSVMLNLSMHYTFVDMDGVV